VSVDMWLRHLKARVLTKGAFERAYAQRSHVTVEFLHQHRRVGKPCDCREDGCDGWQMAHEESEP